MIDQIDKYIEEVQDFTTDDLKQVDKFRIKFLGKKVF